jgi:hypothetical protein
MRPTGGRVQTEVHMPSRALVRAFVVMWWTTGVLLFVWSARTVHEAIRAGRGDDPAEERALKMSNNRVVHFEIPADEPEALSWEQARR